jgi:hypothetical protein
MRPRLSIGQSKLKHKHVSYRLSVGKQNMLFHIECQRESRESRESSTTAEGGRLEAFPPPDARRCRITA